MKKIFALYITAVAVLLCFNINTVSDKPIEVKTNNVVVEKPVDIIEPIVEPVIETIETTQPTQTVEQVVPTPETTPEIPTIPTDFDGLCDYYIKTHGMPNEEMNKITFVRIVRFYSTEAYFPQLFAPDRIQNTFLTIQNVWENDVASPAAKGAMLEGILANL